MLFATMHPDAVLFLVIVGILAVIWGLVQLYLICYHPSVWHKLNEQAEARRTAWQERQREREAARRATKQQVLGTAGQVLRFLLGGKR